VSVSSGGVPSPEHGCHILAFGAHPDDLDFTVGGTLIKASRAGRITVGVDLTGGESGTLGTATRRSRESEKAAGLLGLSKRESLGLPDAGLEFTLPARRAVAAAIRRHRPALILAPWVEDHHPDHAIAGQLVRAAYFEARIAKIAEGDEPWFTSFILYFPCRRYVHPTLVVDVSDVYPRKRKAFLAHRSQIVPKGEKSFRPPGFLDPFTLVERRDRHFGSLIGSEFGEGLISDDPIPCHVLAPLLHD